MKTFAILSLLLAWQIACQANAPVTAPAIRSHVIISDRITIRNGWFHHVVTYSDGRVVHFVFQAPQLR